MRFLYRHEPTCGFYCDGPRMEHSADGGWVRIEDYAEAEKQRDTLRAEVERLRDRMQLVADDIRHEASARRAELAAPRGGQSCGPRGGPLAGANPGVVQGVEFWAKALEEALKPKGGA